MNKPAAKERPDLGPHERLARGHVIQVETMQAGVRHGKAVEHALDRYQARGQITSRQAEAGQRFRQDWETAQHGGISVPQYDGTPLPSSFSSRSPSERIVSAATNYRRTRDAMPQAVREVLVIIACHGVTAGTYAEWNGADRKDVMGRLRLALDVLADYYWPRRT